MQIGEKRHKLKFKIDTGAQANIIPAHTFHKMFGNKVLNPPDSTISGYGGQRLVVEGSCKLTYR